MIFKKFVCEPIQTNCYLFGKLDLVAIDPGLGASESVLDFLKTSGLPLTKILLTHSHYDHIADVFALKKATDAQIYIHTLDAKNLEHPGSDGLPSMMEITGVKADQLLDDGETVTMRDCEMEVIHTPGHSPGGVCFYVKSENLMFTGDTLFATGYGNLSLPTSEPKKMRGSLEKLKAYPGETKIYPGHGESSTIKQALEVIGCY